MAEGASDVIEEMTNTHFIPFLPEIMKTDMKCWIYKLKRFSKMAAFRRHSGLVPLDNGFGVAAIPHASRHSRSFVGKPWKIFSPRGCGSKVSGEK